MSCCASAGAYAHGFEKAVVNIGLFAVAAGLLAGATTAWFYWRALKAFLAVLGLLFFAGFFSLLFSGNESVVSTLGALLLVAPFVFLPVVVAFILGWHIARFMRYIRGRRRK